MKESGNEEHHPRRCPLNRILILGLSIGFFAIVCWFYCTVSNEQDPHYVSFLFLLTTVQVLTFSRLDESTPLYRLSLVGIATSGGILGVSWLSYTFLVTSPRSTMRTLADVLQWLDFFWSFVLVGFTSYLAIHILNANRKERLETEPGQRSWGVQLKGCIESNAAFSICLIFTTLLHVTYALSFSLAFHDKRSGGLYVTPTPSLFAVGDLSLVGGEVVSEEQNFSVHQRIQTALDGDGHSRTVRIIVQGAVKFSGDVGVEGYRNALTASAVEPAMRWLGSRIRFDDPTHVEWLFDTMPDLDHGDEPTTDAPPPDLQELGVAVMLDQSQNPPQLLDYVYFLLYTIVTTGYGDLIPVSTFSKMVCAVANIFESFFTVVLFGVFLKFITPLRRGDG